MLISWSATKMWVSSIMSWLSSTDLINSSETGLIFRLLRKVAVAIFTTIFVVGGALLGVISGAIKGPSSEVGLFGGMSVGAFSGAITAIQLIELIVDGEPFSKVAIICSLLNGKIFIEMVNMETSLRDISGILDVSSTRRGLSDDAINELPDLELNDRSRLWDRHHHTNCAICIEELKDGERARVLPNCKHLFHIKCIDEWLKLQGSCPICRQDASSWQLEQEK